MNEMHVTAMRQAVAATAAAILLPTGGDPRRSGADSITIWVALRLGNTKWSLLHFWPVVKS
jgi:hypothetical protein